MGSGFKNWGAEVAASGDVDGYLMDQSVMCFNDATARDAALVGRLADGMICYVRDINAYYFYDSGISLPAAGVAGWRPWFSQEGAYTPTFNGFTVGDGTAVGAFSWILGRLEFRGQVVLGASSSFSGTLEGIIPGGRTSDAYGSSGTGVILDVSSGAAKDCTIHAAPGGTVFRIVADGGIVNGTTPWTWAAGDVFTWHMICHVTVAG